MRSWLGFFNFGFTKASFQISRTMALLNDELTILDMDGRSSLYMPSQFVLEQDHYHMFCLVPSLLISRCHLLRQVGIQETVFQRMKVS